MAMVTVGIGSNDALRRWNSRLGFGAQISKSKSHHVEIVAYKYKCLNFQQKKM